MGFVPAILAFFILGAHFARAGAWGLVAVSLGCIVLVFVRRAWVRIVIPLLLFSSTTDWLRTTIILVERRVAEGSPFLRMAGILLVVAVFTVGSSWAQRTIRSWQIESWATVFKLFIVRSSSELMREL